jgi:hypothetical protein
MHISSSSQPPASIKKRREFFRRYCIFTMVQATPPRMVAFERRVILEAGYKIQRSNTKTLFWQAFKNSHRIGADLRRQLYLSTTW